MKLKYNKYIYIIKCKKHKITLLKNVTKMNMKTKKYIYTNKLINKKIKILYLCIFRI